MLPSVISFPPCTSTYPVIPLLQRCKSMDQFLQIHALAVKTVQDRHARVLFKLLRLSSSLCSIEYATQIFDAIRCPDVYHYTALIAAYIALTSRHDALRLYSQMVSQLLLPDTVVISYIFKACTLASSLSEGRQLHRQAIKLDLACERPVEMMLASQNSDRTFVLLSNFFSSSGKWQEAAMIRGKMKGKGIQKEPGCSSIEVDNEIHELLLGDIRNPRREEIHKN